MLARLAYSAFDASRQKKSLCHPPGRRQLLPTSRAGGSAALPPRRQESPAGSARSRSRAGG
eukprot:1056941-Alexandrium_andersonii.AAC.1